MHHSKQQRISHGLVVDHPRYAGPNAAYQPALRQHYIDPHPQLAARHIPLQYPSARRSRCNRETGGSEVKVASVTWCEKSSYVSKGMTVGNQCRRRPAKDAHICTTLKLIGAPFGCINPDVVGYPQIRIIAPDNMVVKSRRSACVSAQSGTTSKCNSSYDQPTLLNQAALHNWRRKHFLYEC